MNHYELAKKLSEAGWSEPVRPQDAPGKMISSTEKLPPLTHNQPYYLPTLEELIMACGNDFHCLVHTTTGGMDSDREFWSAGKDSVVLNWLNGSSPREAVATLWLALKSI